MAESVVKYNERLCELTTVTFPVTVAVTRENFHRILSYILNLNSYGQFAEIPCLYKHVTADSEVPEMLQLMRRG